MNKAERRAGLPATITTDDREVRVAGYAAVYGEPADIGGFFREIIAPGAFDAALARRDDVVFLVNHQGLPLARTTSDTLDLTVDARGLHMAAALDLDDPDVRALAPKLRRGDLSKMSFGFIVEREAWDETGDVPERTVQSVRLVDVSVVTHPAYDGTEIALRSLDAHRDATGRGFNFRAAQRRLRMRLNLRP